MEERQCRCEGKHYRKQVRDHVAAYEGLSTATKRSHVANAADTTGNREKHHGAGNARKHSHVGVKHGVDQPVKEHGARGLGQVQACTCQHRARDDGNGRQGG